MTQTLQEMEAELAALYAKVQAEKTRVRTTALEGIKAMLESGTLTADDLRELLPPPPPPERPRRDYRRPPKYRDPESGGTWTGQGAEPNWIKGKNRDQFLIDQRSSISTSSGSNVKGS
jgi:DNA-binding protein H-NS